MRLLAVKFYRFTVTTVILLGMSSCSKCHRQDQQTDNIKYKVQVYESNEFKAVQEKSAMDNKNILLEFSADWCGPCRLFDMQILESENGAKILSNFHFIKIDVDRHGRWGIGDFVVTSLPTFIVLDVRLNELGRISTYANTTQFQADLDTIIRTKTAKISCVSKIEKEISELQLYIDAYDDCVAVGDVASIRVIETRVKNSRLNPKQKDDFFSQALWTKAFKAYNNSPPDYESALKLLNERRMKFRYENSFSEYIEARAMVALGRRSDGNKKVLAIADKYPDDIMARTRLLRYSIESRLLNEEAQRLAKKIEDDLHANPRETHMMAVFFLETERSPRGLKFLKKLAAEHPEEILYRNDLARYSKKYGPQQ